MIGCKGGKERKEEKWWKGQREAVWKGIDHVTAPAITSDVRPCIYCTVMPKEIVSCKNSREKQHLLDKARRGGDSPAIIQTLFTRFVPFPFTLWPQQ